ncbi:MAG: 50S ribosomal protein L15 [Candidatus Magasanikbacteria bacterium RIFCSPHIGHO2_01_FULL_50_8]|uniref:Large ribosomal subunit protein uL15 n=2 Tax=Candidatus Magasanikiibacteriota TaxID=1752731 RepID=A0A1F6LRB6_9BACT|nr:MAG: 50S ribosomal protein L15 [Candidatus Magasanikbacteria bacterium RIFCSPHIGHO2_01_FULL_50_8]OGH67430.1 MAG: 50S ribosomal protein L15 [Candidatus Magasanikbacteria bacterium RIFCSPHIGHO2_02_FULL_50_9b]
MLHGKTFKPKQGARRKSGVLGRGPGSGWGTTAGRGTKGQRARSGGRRGLLLFGSKTLIQSVPKLRGFKSLNVKPTTITLAQLQRTFSDGTIITRLELKTAGFTSSVKVPVKLVGNTKLEKKFTVNGIPTTVGAKAAVEAAGGSVNN